MNDPVAERAPRECFCGDKSGIFRARDGCSNGIWKSRAFLRLFKINSMKIDCYALPFSRFSLKVDSDAAIKTRSQSRDSCCYKVLGAKGFFFVAPSTFQVDSRWELLIHIYCS